MIEQGLYFALGFFVAALLALAVLPAFWRRAYRLTRREIEATLPLSPKEIAAERDQLRAKFAVERIQLEQQMEAAAGQRQKAMATTGEKSVHIARLDDDAAGLRRDIERLNTTISGLETVLAETQHTLAERESSLASTSTALASLGNDHQVLTAACRDLQDVSDARRIEIASQKTNLEAQQVRIAELDQEAKAQRAENRTQVEQMRTLQRRIHDLEKDLAIQTSRVQSAEEISEKRAAIIGERDARVEDLRQKVTQLARIGKEADTALKQETRKFQSVEQLMSERDVTIKRLRDDAKQTASDLTTSIEKLRAEKQKLQTDLTEARAKAAQVQRELTALRRAPATQDLRPRTAAAK